MKSYVGLGIMHYPNALEVATEVNRLGCTVAKSLGNAGYLDEIAKQVPPTTKLIGSKVTSTSSTELTFEAVDNVGLKTLYFLNLHALATVKPPPYR